MFCGLPHEGEGQDVTGEDEGALPVPGGIGRASGEGRSRKARWEDRAGLCIAGDFQSVQRGGVSLSLSIYIYISFSF